MHYIMHSARARPQIRIGERPLCYAHAHCAILFEVRSSVARCTWHCSRLLLVPSQTFTCFVEVLDAANHLAISLI